MVSKNVEITLSIIYKKIVSTSKKLLLLVLEIILFILVRSEKLGFYILRAHCKI